MAEVKAEMAELESEIEKDYPPTLEVDNIIQYRTKADGTEYATVTKAKEKYPITKVSNGNLVCYDYKPFKPGSASQRVEKLWEAGWKPFEKTKTHQQFGRVKVGDPYGKKIKSLTQEEYDEKKKHFEHYGWVVNEDNLSTLPKDAPEGARKLAKWLTLEGRRSSLVEWIGQVKADGRIHGTTNGLGAWTGRMSHKDPNTANIASVWPKGKPVRTAVDEVKARYDTEMRACWDVPEGCWQVGVDADGIQLRVLADYLWRLYDKDSYAKAIMEGKKEDETDIHNMNRKALGLSHITRDDSKTFIYSWALNAGIPKTASILKTTIPIASKARDRFESSIEGLKPFKKMYLPKVAKDGYFVGYDDRKVIVPNLHKTLAGILQNGEACIMKHARIKWGVDLKGTGIRYKPLSLVHDEFNTEVSGTREEAEYVKEVQKESILWAGKELGFLIPTPGTGEIGLNWSEVH